MTKDWKEIHEKLSEPFAPDQVGWKPTVTTKGRDKKPIMRNGRQVAGCVAHIDARNVMNRLDAVVGAENWSDSYKVLDGKHVECTLTVLGVSKSDVGETNTGGVADPIKSAYSDAFKRAAVKFGIGRHLYEMEMQWLPFDGYKILDKPQAPKRQTRQRPQRTTNGTADARAETSPQQQATRQRPSAPKATTAGKQGNGNGGNGADWKAKALAAKSLATFASAAALGLDDYTSEQHVTNALESVEGFEYNAAKNEAYWNWLKDRKQEKEPA